MRSFYRRLSFTTGLFGLSCFFSLSSYANPTLEQCIHHCHTKALNLKDFKDCKASCEKRIKKRPHKEVYHKNYSAYQQTQRMVSPAVPQAQPTPVIVPQAQQSTPLAASQVPPASVNTPPAPQVSAGPAVNIPEAPKVAATTINSSDVPPDTTSQTSVPQTSVFPTPATH